jgi:hypothetical protein
MKSKECITPWELFSGDASVMNSHDFDSFTSNFHIFSFLRESIVEKNQNSIKKCLINFTSSARYSNTHKKRIILFIQFISLIIETDETLRVEKSNFVS